MSFNERQNPDFFWSFFPKLTGSSSDEDVDFLIREFRELAKNLYQPLPINLGSNNKIVERASKAWIQIKDCAVSLETLVNWLVALKSPVYHPYCDLCFRHKSPALRKRCRDHTSSGTNSKEVRDALLASEIFRRIYERKFETSTQMELAELALKSVFKTEELSDIEKSSSNYVDLLGSRLRHKLQRLEAINGAIVAANMQHFLVELVSTVKKCYVYDEELTPQEIGALQKAQSQVESKLSIREFLKFWYGNEKWPLHQDFSISGRAKDRDHPSIRDFPYSIKEFAYDLIRQNAWFEAEFHLISARRIDVLKASELKKEIKSLSAIGREMKASGKTIKLALSSTPPSRLRLRKHALPKDF